jgi:hypothetical protein
MAITTGGGVAYDQGDSFRAAGQMLGQTVRDASQRQQFTQQQALDVGTQKFTQLLQMAQASGTPTIFLGSPMGQKMFNEIGEAYSVATGKRLRPEEILQTGMSQVGNYMAQNPTAQDTFAYLTNLQFGGAGQPGAGGSTAPVAPSAGGQGGTVVPPAGGQGGTVVPPAGYPGASDRSRADRIPAHGETGQAGVSAAPKPPFGGIKDSFMIQGSPSTNARFMVMTGDGQEIPLNLGNIAGLSNEEIDARILQTLQTIQDTKQARAAEDQAALTEVSTNPTTPVVRPYPTQQEEEAALGAASGQTQIPVAPATSAPSAGQPLRQGQGKGMLSDSQPYAAPAESFSPLFEPTSYNADTVPENLLARGGIRSDMPTEVDQAVVGMIQSPAAPAAVPTALPAPAPATTTQRTPIVSSSTWVAPRLTMNPAALPGSPGPVPAPSKSVSAQIQTAIESTPIPEIGKAAQTAFNKSFEAAKRVIQSFSPDKPWSQRDKAALAAVTQRGRSQYEVIREMTAPARDARRKEVLRWMESASPIELEAAGMAGVADRRERLQIAEIQAAADVQSALARAQGDASKNQSELAFRFYDLANGIMNRIETQAKQEGITTALAFDRNPGLKRQYEQYMSYFAGAPVSVKLVIDNPGFVEGLWNRVTGVTAKSQWDLSIGNEATTAPTAAPRQIVDAYSQPNIKRP